MLVIPFICMCCALSASAASSQMGLGYRGHYGYGQGSGEGEVPGVGDCANTGVVFPDNPFSGWPVDYKAGDWSTITFSYCNLYPDGSPHWGIDLGVPNGTRVLATTERAVVRQAQGCGERPDCWNYGMGRYVQIEAQVRIPDYDQCVAEHGGNSEADECWANTGWVATYMHLDSVNVQVGHIVWRGQVLGRTDDSGNSSGPHLHYQINSPAAGAVDPAPSMGG